MHGVMHAVVVVVAGIVGCSLSSMCGYLSVIAFMTGLRLARQQSPKAFHQPSPGLDQVLLHSAIALPVTHLHILASPFTSAKSWALFTAIQ